MAYKELIKNFDKIREYLRDFYVYGFKNRDDYAQNAKSARTYDDEKRRIESWLGDYMSYRKSADGKTVFLSIDPRDVQHNPFYKAWKTKSFTDIDITLHFILLDILIESKNPISLKEILTQIDSYLCKFKTPKIVDESTIRKKLNEYIEEGIVFSKKDGKTSLYSLCPLTDFEKNSATKNQINDVLNFYSEVAPCGVIGSFLLDKNDFAKDNSNSTDDSTLPLKNHFYFKHHYITSAMDSEILCEIFSAIRQRRNIEIEVWNRKSNRVTKTIITPLQILISVQLGRQYLMGFYKKQRRISSFRLDNIVSVTILDDAINFEEKRVDLEKMKKNMWGVSTNNDENVRMEHIDFTIYFGDDENFIYNRLVREKRCGTVEKLDEHHAKFSADIFNASELKPWLRTFICRITEINFSNQVLQKEFDEDLKQMYEMYGV